MADKSLSQQLKETLFYDPKSGDGAAYRGGDR